MLISAIFCVLKNYCKIHSSPFLSSTYPSSIEKGGDIYCSYTAKYNNSSLNALGLATAVDSLAAIRQLVFEEKKYTLLEFANILQCGFTGMIIGHKFNSNKIVRSVLYGFIVYMLSQGFVLLCTFIVGLFNKSIMNLFITEGLIDLSHVKMVAYIAMGVYALVLIVLCFVNIKLFKKGVNVD